MGAGASTEQPKRIKRFEVDGVKNKKRGAEDAAQLRGSMYGLLDKLVEKQQGFSNRRFYFTGVSF